MLATLWRIDDTFSEKVINHFYQGLAQGLSPAEALGASQREVIRQFSEKAVPYYWAGFVIDGSADHALISNRGDGTLLHNQRQRMP